MSHSIEYFSYPENCDKRKVEYVLNDYVKHRTYEEGGLGLGCQIKWKDSVIYPDYDAAVEAIKRLDNGWYDQIAVLYRELLPKVTSKRRDELRARLADTNAKFNELNNQIAAQTFKAQFVGCRGCGSKLNKKYIKSNICPVCRADMRSDTTLARLSGYREKINKLCDELRKEEQKLATKCDAKWLVKIEYHV